MNFDKIVNVDFPEKLRDELFYFENYFEEHKGEELDDDKKEDIAKLILTLMEETGDYEDSIKRTSFAIVNVFYNHMIDWKIDTALRLLSELQLPEGMIHDNVADLWSKSRDYLLSYLDEGPTPEAEETEETVDDIFEMELDND